MKIGGMMQQYLKRKVIYQWSSLSGKYWRIG
jgi:hypothetical protein